MKSKQRKPSLPKRIKNDLLKTLDEIEEILVTGYTHDNFNRVARCVNQISCYLDQRDLDALGVVWRNTYTDSVEQVVVNDVIEEIRQRF